MVHPGVTVAVLVGVAITTFLYTYFTSGNTNDQHRYSNSGHNSNSTFRPPSGYDTDHNPRSAVNTVMSCIICLEALEESRMCKLRCEHKFHQKCIKEWFYHDPSCPVCRQVMNF